MIWGEGNPTAPIFIVLDNPGAREDKDNCEFLCGTRETLQLAAFAAGLELDDLYITFLLKCRPRKAYDKPNARTTCIKYLWKQLEDADPATVVCLGDVVCQAFFADPDGQVKNLRGTIHRVKDYQVIASYHPLAARRRPALFKYLVEDLQLIRD